MIAGFDPVGQAFGATVTYPSSAGLGRCFIPSSSWARGDARTSADPRNRPLAKLTAARGPPPERAAAQCRALGGDGIIRMRVSATNFFSHTMRFTVEATTVRTRSRTRPGTLAVTV